MEENWCELLRVQAVPHICMPGTGTALQLEGIISFVGKEAIPRSLGQQLEKLIQSSPKPNKIEYFTIFHIGQSLNTENSYVALELMPQPYVFYDVKSQDSEKKSRIMCGIYTLEGPQASQSVRELPGQVKVNPGNIKDSWAEIILDYNKRKICGETKFELSTLLPIQVFYTLTLVEYNGNIDRVAVCKNVVSFNDSNNFGRILTRIAQAESHLERIESQTDALRLLSSANPRNSDLFDSEVFDILTETIAGTQNESVKNWIFTRFKYYVWDFSGKPQGDADFGLNEYHRLYELSLLEPEKGIRWNWATEFLNRCLEAVIDEVFEWVRKF